MRRTGSAMTGQRPGGASPMNSRPRSTRGEYVLGDTLPASVALAERYGVHRHTVRQAFRHLAEQGLVTVSRGRGTQVRRARVPYPIGRRVSMRTNFGKLGITGIEPHAVGGEVVVGEAETCAALKLEMGAPLWRVEGVSLADGTPMGTGTHWLSVRALPGFRPGLSRGGRLDDGGVQGLWHHDYVRLSTRLTARLASEREAALRIAPGAAVLGRSPPEAAVMVSSRESMRFSRRI
jgi:GntR family phosphonate transport system transcriptional regulator